jgi:hypothetical protein
MKAGEALRYVAGGSPFRNLGQISEERLDVSVVPSASGARKRSGA